MLKHVDEVELVAGLQSVSGKVHDDVVALRNCLDRQHALVFVRIAVAIEIMQAIEGDAVFHDVAVVGDEVKRDSVPGYALGPTAPDFALAVPLHFLHQRHLEVTRH